MESPPKVDLLSSFSRQQHARSSAKDSKQSDEYFSCLGSSGALQATTRNSNLTQNLRLTDKSCKLKKQAALLKKHQ
jgi:hypothetical protein